MTVTFKTRYGITVSPLTPEEIEKLNAERLQEAIDKGTVYQPYIPLQVIKAPDA